MTEAPFQPRPEIQAMVGYHSPQVDCSVRLNTNESPFPPPAEWQEALADEVASIDFRRYPDRTACALRVDLAKHHTGRTQIGPDNVFVANGSNEVLQTLCLTYAGSGRSVLVFEPTYAMHSHIARTSGARVVVGPRREDHTIDPHVALDLIEREQPAITFLCSPNNPTGLAEPRQLIEAVVAAAPGIVLIDEAYGQFADWSAIELIAENRAVCVSRTYSKTWAMAGSRLGYLLAPTWMTTEFDKVVLPYHLDSVKQAGGRLALRYVGEMRDRVAELVAQRNRIFVELQKLPIDVWPSQSNFVLFRPRDMRADDVWQELVSKDVLVRNCSSWPGLTNCLRVTVGTGEENSLFIAALNEVVSTVSTGVSL
jgi:histidinol-phosphate aminotransferase